MQRILDSRPRRPVVIVGADIADLNRTHVAAAFEALGRSDFVIGPAVDGGYWLLGSSGRRSVGPALEAVRWSGPHALADTLAGLRPARVAMLSTLSDVDTADDWIATRNTVGRRVQSIPRLQPQAR
jgi:glycosyltransferase A (GT-A) superfamily protein (DUF2064 family)